MSLFRNATYRPRASRTPALLPPAKPRFSAQRDDPHPRKPLAHVVHRPVGRRRCRRESSRGRSPCCAATASRHASRCCRPFQVTMTIETSGRVMRARDPPCQHADAWHAARRRCPRERRRRGRGPRWRIRSRTQLVVDDLARSRRSRRRHRSGSSRMPASPSTSGIDAARDAITGVPLAIASSTGRPNPS